MVPEPATAVDQGELDQEPEGDKTDQGAERECGAGSLGPDEEIENEDCGEQKAGEKEGCHESVPAPVLSVERFVDASGEIPGKHAGKDKETHADADEAAAKAGVEDTEGAENEEAGGHEDELGA